MREQILKIEERSFRLPEQTWAKYNGYVITTNIQTIMMGIMDIQHCCENWGYLMTNDNTSEFEGSILESIKIIDKDLEEVHTIIGDFYDDEMQVMFVNLETSNGLLQFVAYNEHNGYYGHDAVLISNQLNHTQLL